MFETVVYSPLFGIVLSIAAFEAGIWIQKRPARRSATPGDRILLCIAVLVLFDIPLEAYNKGGDIINLSSLGASCHSGFCRLCGHQGLCFHLSEALRLELREHGIRALILDVDNTLTGHGSQQLPPAIAAWLQTMKESGVKLRVASNNMPGRVRPFAQKLGLAICTARPSPALR